MERQQWMEALLRLHYEQKFGRGAACRQLGVNVSTGYKFFRRFEQSGLPWPLPGEITACELEQKLYPSEGDISRISYPSTKRQRRPNFTPEFKRHLVEQSMQPGVNVAQLARQHGLNDNLLFNWRRQYLHGQNKNTPDASVTLMPVEVMELQRSVIDAVPERSVPIKRDDTLCCEMILPGGTLKLSGVLPPALLRMLLDELKGTSQ